MYQRNFVNSQHFTGTANVEYAPTETFRLSGAFGMDFAADDAVEFRPYRWNVDQFSGSEPDGSREVNEDRSREITADVKGSHVHRTDRIENTFLFGGQGFLRQRQSAGGEGRDFPGPGLETLSALGSQASYETWLRVTQIGGYLQDQIGVDDWFFLTVGGRWDANSALRRGLQHRLLPPRYRFRFSRCGRRTGRRRRCRPSVCAAPSGGPGCSRARSTSSRPSRRRVPRRVRACGPRTSETTRSNPKFRPRSSSVPRWAS